MKQLAPRIGDEIYTDDDVSIKIIDIQKSQIFFSVTALSDIHCEREELYRKIQASDAGPLRSFTVQ